MHIEFRTYRDADQQPVVDLSLRAWTPVFASMRHTLGDQVFERLHGSDWRSYQANAVRNTLADADMAIRVAETGHVVVGFVAATVRDPAQRLGEITMLAVDPGNQRQGIGSGLTSLATAWLATKGMQVVMIETGGDPGHAPARRIYERANYAPMPIARYFKAL